MSSKTLLYMIILPWISLPVFLATYFALWDRMPDRLAVHFDFSGRPNGWMSRGQFIMFDIIVLLFVLTSFSLKLWGRRGDFSWGTVASYYLRIALVGAVFIAVLKYNL